MEHFYLSTFTCPSLTPDQLQNFEGSGITTLMDILFKNKAQVMSAGMLNLAEYETLKSEVMEFIQPSPIYGSQILYQTSHHQKLTTGIGRLDNLLGGGLYGGESLEIFGEAGIGKTQFCTAISARFIKRNQSVAYFDLKANFSAKRLEEYCEGVSKNFDNIEIIQPACLTDLMEDLDEIWSKISDNPDAFFSKLKLMVFDSVPMTIYSAVDEDVKSWRYFQEKFSEKVLQLSKLNGGISIIFVNHAVTKRVDSKSKRKVNQRLVTAAMGSSYWGHRPNFRLQLGRDPETPKVCNAILRKSSRTQSDTMFRFTIGSYMIECFD